MGERSVLILRRFDRAGDGSRIGYMSAMTATGSNDGDRRDYADVAESMRDLSGSLRRDQHELYDRVAVSVALGNTDDHLRNHGFLVDRGAWTLSPAFDVNPNPDLARNRATSIMGADTFPDEVDGLLALAEECGLTLAKGRERLGRLVQALAGWEQVARAHRIPGREISLMAESIGPRLEAIRMAAGGGA